MNQLAENLLVHVVDDAAPFRRSLVGMSGIRGHKLQQALHARLMPRR